MKRKWIYLAVMGCLVALIVPWYVGAQNESGLGFMTRITGGASGYILKVIAPEGSSITGDNLTLAVGAGGGNMVGANNLSELSDHAAARANLGDGNASTIFHGDGSLSSLAARATVASALDADPDNCAAGQLALGIAASGAAQCTATPSLLALTLYGQAAGGGAQLALGSSSTSSDPNTGKIAFRNLTNANIFTFQTGVVTSSWTMTGPTAPPAGNSYLFHVNTDGTTGYTDPATLGNSPTIAGTGLTSSRAYYMGASALALAKADSSTTMPALCVSDSTTTCRYSGVVVLGSAVAGCTRGKQAYVSAATAGLLTCTQPTSSGNQVQRVGTMVADDNASILVTPSPDVFTAP